MKTPRKAVRIGVPILVVGVLALLALWRVGAMPRDVATTSAPVASLEDVEVRTIASQRAAWVRTRAAGGLVDKGEEAFIVLDPDVKGLEQVAWMAGARATLIGIVRPAPAAAQAIRQWQIDEATARELEQRGTYVHVTEVRSAE